VLGPRLVIAGTSSGVGKTTVATGLMAAFRRRSACVASAKVGPDFIDPGYHSAATGRPGRNLDAWMCGPSAIPPLAARAAKGCDLLIVEGVMGLFDGAADGGAASTADVARLISAPVVLVVDARSMSQSVAALVSGYRSFDPRVHIAGVVLNQVGSDNHEIMLREALAAIDMPVFGVLRRDDSLVWRDRHLGLVPVVEQPERVAASLDKLATLIERGCDLDAFDQLARSAPAMVTELIADPQHVGKPRIAIASGPAFSFCYPDNLEMLAAAGAELIPFDPRRDPLPEGVAGLVAGGGFPEVFAAELSENVSLLDDLRRRIANGLVVWAECGGLLWLCRSLDSRKLAGLIEAEGTMTKRLHLGYRSARTLTETPLGPAGTELRGHEFHYSTVAPAGEALQFESRFTNRTDGFASPTMLATYLHVHLATRPDLAESFVRSAFGRGGLL
jgi:cobyrinic acid a,c-diamide synthase